MPHSRTQLLILALIPIPSALLSIIGSCLIIYLILKDMKQKLSGPYHRILFCYSFFDLISSSGALTSTIPSPSDTPNIALAIGNDSTCAAQGFLFVVGSAAIHYNSFLMLYYLLTIRYNMSQKAFGKIEPFGHGLIVLLGITPGVLAAIFGMLNNIRNICFIAPYPSGCDKNEEIECERGENAFIFKWLFVGIPVSISFVFLPFSMALLTWTVQKKIEGMNQHNANIQVRNESRLTFQMQSTIKIKRVKSQAFCYVCASMLCLAFALANQSFKDQSPFVLNCIAQIFYSLQGFFNFINYIRPRVATIRKHDMTKSWLYAAYLGVTLSEDTLKRKQKQMKLRQAWLDRRRSLTSANSIAEPSVSC